MEIIVGKTAGFCYGVKRAIDGVKEESKNNRLFCIGEIVHNRQVIEDLQNKGVNFVEDISKVHDAKSKVAIRAHGVKKEIYEIANKNKIDIIDYTCPNVLRIHEIAKEYAEKGFYIILCGKKEHPENVGTISYCGKNYSVIQDEKELKEALKRFEKTKIKKLLVISQTTFSLKKFTLIEQAIKEELKDEENIIIKNTICRATELRQKETEELLKLSPCKLAGPNPNETGNFCVVGHNYRNQRFFSKVPTLEIGEEILITDLTKDVKGNTVKYKIYNKYNVDPEDVSCLEQKTKGKNEITLITCTDDSKQRVIVKAKEV